MRVAVVVLGDVGRSPRMQYHALALADAGADVELIGETQNEPFAAVRAHPRIRLRPLRFLPPPSGSGDIIARGLLRAWRQGVGVLATLSRRDTTFDVILVQSPPAIPTVAVALLAAHRRRARLVIDWHNLGFAMLGLRVGPAHPAVRIAARLEAMFGRRADAHLCVSRAMRDVLAERWEIEATVLYDRPARQFVPLPTERREAVVRDLCRRVGFRGEGRPVVVMGPTSWSADEDFPLLAQALAQCDAQLRDAPGPHLLVLLTGKGPLRATYEAEFAARPGTRVHTHAIWLPADEYASALAAADLGLSLHRSASGLDLPMKIADMFGAGVAVCALDYGVCLREILQPGENALLFTSATQLADQLCGIVREWPAASAALERLRSKGMVAAAERWDDAWRAHAAAVILGQRAPAP